MAEQLPSRMSVELSLAGGEPVEVYDRAIGPAPEAYHLADVMAWWDALPPVLRGFLANLSADRLDDTTLGVFADWLEEHGQAALGQRVRLLRPQPGDVLVLWVGSLFAAPRRAALAGVTLPQGVAAVALYEDERLEAIDPDQLRAAGWVREEEAGERVRAEREACARTAEASTVLHEDQYGTYAAPSPDGLQIASAIRHRGDSA